MDEVNADIRLCEEDSRPSGQSERTLAVNQNIPEIVQTNARSQEEDVQRVKYPENKAVFRFDEKMADRFDLSKIDADRVIRAALTGNRNELTEAELRTLTPTTGGAMLSVEISSIILDNLRQSNWMDVLRPTVVEMGTNEVKIPWITALPTSVMHTPGEEETPTDPTITAATLTAQTILCVVSVANELLQDSATSQGAILEACVSSISNKLLEQVLYGNGTPPNLKGITYYAAELFADAGNKAGSDIYDLVTLAKSKIMKANGELNALIYDCDLEPAFDSQNAEGDGRRPTRTIQKLYDNNQILAHPSVAAGDLIFMDNKQLYLGMRQGLEIQTDPYSAFTSNNTRFRVIMRGDIFANVARMVYYNGVTL